jgi:hypothetical protein
MAGTAGGDPRLGSVIAGYRAKARVWRGGMSVVYRPREERLERDWH